MNFRKNLWSYCPSKGLSCPLYSIKRPVSCLVPFECCLYLLPFASWPVSIHTPGSKRFVGKASQCSNSKQHLSCINSTTWPWTMVCCTTLPGKNLALLGMNATNLLSKLWDKTSYTSWGYCQHAPHSWNWAKEFHQRSWTVGRIHDGLREAIGVTAAPAIWEMASQFASVRVEAFQHMWEHKGVTVTAGQYYYKTSHWISQW